MLGGVGLIYIGGMSRSGTTLCQGMITNSRRTIGMTAEASYFRALMEAYKQSTRAGFWNHLTDYFVGFEQFHGFHRDIVQMWINRVRARHESGYIVQKEPRLLRVWPELYDFFPKAFYIIVYRDPRDILASQMKRMEGQKWNADQWWGEQLTNIAYAMQGQQDNIWVRYENLVTQPRETLDQLEQALGFEIPLSEWQVKRKDDSCSPLDGKLPDPSSIGKWKEVLPKEAAETVEEWRPWFVERTGLDWFWEDK